MALSFDVFATVDALKLNPPTDSLEPNQICPLKCWYWLIEEHVDRQALLDTRKRML
jgi:hypothetical protein